MQGRHSRLFEGSTLPALYGGLALISFTLNEVIGSSLLYLLLLITVFLIIMHPLEIFKMMTENYKIYWLVPIFAICSTAWSSAPTTTLRASLQFFLTVAIANFVGQILKTRNFVSILACIYVPVCLICLLNGRGGLDGMTGRVNLIGFFENKSTLNLCACFGIFACLSIFLDNSRYPFTRVLSLLSLPMLLIVAFRARSVAGLAAMFASCAILILITNAKFLDHRLRRKYVEIVLMTIFIFALPAMILISTFQDDILLAVGKDPTLTGRTVLWYYAARIWPQNAVIGTGYSAFWIQGYSMAEHLWNILHIQSRGGFHFHNIFYEILIGLGLVGLTVFLVAMLSAIVKTTKALLNNQDAGIALCAAMIVFTQIMQMQNVDLILQFNHLLLVFIYSMVQLCKQSVPARRNTFSMRRNPNDLLVRPRIPALVEGDAHS